MESADQRSSLKSVDMTKPCVWWVLPAFAITPKKTFFGLDKGSSHCFTLDKRLYGEIEKLVDSGAIQISESSKTSQIVFMIGGQNFQAEIRRVDINRTKPRSRQPEDHPARVVYQFQWKPFQKTVFALRDAFLDAWLNVSEGKNSEERIEFHHMGDNRFLVRQTIFGSEWNTTEIFG